MAGYLDRIHASIPQHDRVFSIQHTLNNQVAGPHVAQFGKRVPVGTCAAFCAVKGIPGHVKVRYFRAAFEQRGQGPARVHCKIDELFGANAERHCKTVAQLARAASDFGNVYCEDDGFIASGFGAFDQFESPNAVTTEIQLEPCVAFSGFD